MNRVCASRVRLVDDDFWVAVYLTEHKRIGRPYGRHDIPAIANPAFVSYMKFRFFTAHDILPSSFGQLIKRDVGKIEQVSGEITFDVRLPISLREDCAFKMTRPADYRQRI